MYIRCRLCLAICLLTSIQLQAQTDLQDTISADILPEIVVSGSYHFIRNRAASQQLEVAGKEYFRSHFTGSFAQSLNHLPGIQSMDIGSGISKPVIRGFGFNRITVVEDGIKQEGQQWGSDHGLEIDPFNVENVVIRKGSSSLMYGSDAMAGAIEIQPIQVPFKDQVAGDLTLLGKTVNSSIGASLSLGVKKGRWFGKLRYTEQHYGDYRIPADTVIYLTQKMPVYGRRLKNTAGFERDIHAYNHYANDRYSATLILSNVYQKAGFYPGAHGIPDLSRLQDDGDSRNIEYPFNKVNHFKSILRQKYSFDTMALAWDIGYQNNHREEWSLFHTHYTGQTPPEKDPDKELSFDLNTYNSHIKALWNGWANWDNILGWDIQHQDNTVGGYSFLLPEYSRFTTGIFLQSVFYLNNSVTLSGGLRYDMGKIKVQPFTDAILGDYLSRQGYGQDIVESYMQRSYKVNRIFHDYSFSAGIAWIPYHNHLFKLNIGRSFRLPGAHELAINGVHHGTFRHEQGDTSLQSERGWQVDGAYSYESPLFNITFSPFLGCFENYIFLKPTGEWSLLPHAGQVYRYSEVEALFAGGELSVGVRVWHTLSYYLTGEYVYTYNCDEHTALSFSPPFTLRNSLWWENKYLKLNFECQYIARQDRLARNEDITPGVVLFHAGAGANVHIGKLTAEVSLNATNLFNKKYYNHLSFYRKVEIPEPGRSFQLLIKIPFNNLTI